MGFWSRVLAVVGVVGLCVGLLQAAPDSAAAAEIPSPDQVEWDPPEDWVTPEPPRPDGVPDPWAEVSPLDPVADSEPWEESGPAGEALVEIREDLAEAEDRAREAVAPSTLTLEVHQPDPIVGDAAFTPEDLVQLETPPQEGGDSSPTTPGSQSPSPAPLVTSSPTTSPGGSTVSAPLAARAGGQALGASVVAATLGTVRATDWVSPEWCASPNGQWGFSIGTVTTVSAVSNTQQGIYDFEIRNRGTMSIPAGTVFRYTVFDAGGHAYLPSHSGATLTAAITSGATRTVRMTIDTLTPGQTWATVWDANVPGVGLITDAGGCPPNVYFAVVNRAPQVTLLLPNIGETIQGTTPYLSASGVDPDRWPNATLTYSFTICSDAAMTANCIDSGPVSSFTWQVPAPGLNWGGRYYWTASVFDGEITVDSAALYPPNDFAVVAPLPDEWRRVGVGLGMASVDGLIMPYGIFVSAASDASVSGAEQPLTVDRVYSSGADAIEGAFGRGWLSVFDARLVMPSSTSGIATVTYPDGRQESFGRNSDGTWASAASLGSTNRFTVDGNGAAKVDETTGTTNYFDRYGRLSRVVFGDSEWQVTRTGSEITRLTQLPSGRSLTVTWGSDSGSCADAPQSTRRHVSSIGVTGDPDAVWTYQYHCSRLVSVTNPEGGVTRYTTTANSFAGTSPGGTPLPGAASYGTWTTASSDYQQRSVVLTVPGSVNRTVSLLRSRGTQNYLNTVNSYGGPVAKYCEYRTITSGVESCPQSLTTLYFDSKNRLVSKQRSGANEPRTDANSRTWHYDPGTGFLDFFIDENGHTSSYNYDAWGNPTSTWVWRDQNTPIDAVTYYRDPTAADPEFRVSGFRLNDIQSWFEKWNMYAYDDDGHLIQRVGPATPAAPNGETSIYQYTSGQSAAYGSDGEVIEGATAPAGLLRAATNLGGLDEYRYAANGDLTSFATVGSGYTGRTYDDAGYVTSETTSGTTGAEATTRFVRDDLGRTVSEARECTTNPITGERTRLEIGREYNGDGQVLQSTETAIDCTTQQSVAAARTTTFEYDAAGRLKTMVGPTGGTTTYTYDAANPSQVKTMTDPRGRVYTYTYSALTGQVATVYADVQSSYGPLLNRLIASYQYDLAGRLKSEVDAAGRVTEYTYTDDDLLKRTVRKNVGNTNNSTKRDVELWRGTYDGRGKITSETVGGSRTTTYFYDSEGRLQYQTLDPGGMNRTTTYTRDAQGRLTQVSTSEGTRTESVRYTVDAAGNPLTATVENGSTDLTTSYLRDQNELITSTISPRSTASSTPGNGATSVEYDALGRVTHVTGPLISTAQPGNATDFTGISRTNARATETFGYNAFGDLTHTQDASGNVTEMTYDQAGHLTETTSAEYVAPGATSAETAHTIRTYSPAGDLLTETSPRGATTTYTYDIAGNNTRIDIAVPGGGHRTTVMGYNAASELYALVDPRGGSQGIFYDALARVSLTTVYPLEEGGGDGGITLTNYSDYDDVGNLTDTWLRGIDLAKNGAHTRYQYNAAGELTARWDPGVQNPTIFVRDLAGRITLQTDPDGVITEHVYDLAGRETSTTRVGTDGTRLTTNYTYDPDGNLLTTQRPNGQTQTWAYDLAGNPNALTETITATTTRTAQLEYDTANRVVRTLDARGHATWNTYNTWGLLERRIEPSTSQHAAITDRTWSYAYDVDQQVATEAAPGGVTRTFTYDQLGQLTGLTATNPVAPNATVSHQYAYSNAGDLTSMDSPGGTEQYTWGSVGQLLTVRGPNANVDYGYDDWLRPGSRTDYGFTSPEGYPRSSGYIYDQHGRLTQTYDGFNRNNDKVVRTYDLNTGKPATDTYTAQRSPSLNFQLSGTVGYSYDAFGRRYAETVKDASAAVLQDTHYEYDAADNITQRLVTGSTVTGGDSYTYDLASRLIEWEPLPAPGDPPLAASSYTWDANDNRTGSTDGVTSQSWTYDQRNRLTTAITTTGGSALTSPAASDARGNLTTIGSRALAYDALDNLTSDGSTVYQYDGLNRPTLRTSAQPPLDTQQLRYDPFSRDPYATVSANGTDEATFATQAGGPILSRNMTTGAAGVLLPNTHTDLTTQLTPTGTTTGDSAYTPFGQRIAGSPDSGITTYLGFQGDWTDPTTGTIRMGARWYDPTLGTFLTRDTLTLPLTAAGSTNRYTYGNGNPVSMIDPTGHVPVPVLAGGAVAGLGALAQLGLAVGAVIALAATVAVVGEAIRPALPGLGAAASQLGQWAISQIMVLVAKAVALAAQAAAWLIAQLTKPGVDTTGPGIEPSPPPPPNRQPPGNPPPSNPGPPPEPLIDRGLNPFRPGILIEQTINGAISALLGPPSRAQSDAADRCGLGGTLAACQTPNTDPRTCSEIDATANLCVPAEPRPGPAGATQANTAMELIHAQTEVQTAAMPGPPKDPDDPEDQCGETKGGTYVLRDRQTGEIIRTGRTNDFNRREAEHLRDPRLPAHFFDRAQNTNSYGAQRGLEQRLYDANPQAVWRDDGTGGFNKRRPISPLNPNRNTYIELAEQFLELCGG